MREAGKSLSDEPEDSEIPTASGINNLLQDLTCLQCRAVLLEWKQSI